MAKKTVTVKGTLLVLEYCSQKVMKKLVKAGEYENQANAFSGEFYMDTLWTKVDALYVDEEEKNNLLQNVGTIVRTTDYFHELFSNESTHPLPVELHYRKQEGKLDYVIELEDGEAFDIKKLQLVYSNELPNSEFSGVVELPKTILGSKILYDGKEIAVLEDDAYDNYGIYGRIHDTAIVNSWKDCFAIKDGVGVIPAGTTTIEPFAFKDCTDLTSIVIPDSVTTIWDGAFSGCSGLTSIVVSKGNKVYDSRNNCNAIIKTEYNELIVGCKNTVIPDSVVKIGESAFVGCTGLTSIVISKSVTKIGSRTFKGCSGLTSIVVADGNEDYDSRDNCNAIISTKSNELITGCMNTVIPSSVAKIGGCAFEGCIGLTSIDIPESVTRIEWHAFEGCTGLTSINIPNSVESGGPFEVGNSALFRDCTGLKSVVIQAKWKTIDYAMFGNCTSLETVTLPAGVSKIDSGAFVGCNALKTIFVPAKKVDYYKKRLPENLHSLIVELPAEKRG